MKNSRVIVLTLAVAVFGPRVHGQLVDGINAIVHDSVVTYREVEVYATPARQQLERQYRNQPDTLDNEIARIRAEGLETLMERQLILHDFESSGYTLPESVIEDAVQDEIDRFGGRTKLTKTLQAEGMTFEKFRRQMRDQFIIRVLRSKNVQQEVIISPHKIETYYLAHQEKFKLEDETRIRMIVLNKPSEVEAASVRQLAREIVQKIKEGAAFSEMAAVYSQGRQRNEGGDWGWIDRKTLRKELGDVAFSLKPGSVSDVIETPEACYIMLVEERRAAHVKPLADVQEEIEKTMLDQEHARLQKQYVNRLKKKTFVRYF